jgi:multidrug efflux pump subunit AcrA (membrane-fusion protein)
MDAPRLKVRLIAARSLRAPLPNPPVTAMIGRTSEHVSSASPSDSSRGPDEDAVLRAKQEIQSLVQEVVELSRSEIEEPEFFAAMLDKAIAALAAIGGVVWTLEEGKPFKLQYQVNLQQTGLGASPEAQAQHARLLTQIAKRGEAVLVPPHSGTGAPGENGEELAANPTDYLLVVAPISTDRGVDGLVEVFQRTGGRPTTQQGYLRFLVQLCTLAGEYLKTRRLRHFVTKQTLWEQLENFTASVHTKLDSRQTAFTIANEGRRLIGCDRVTVVLRKGPKYVVEAISGMDTFDKRSNTVRMLRELATVVARSGEDLWYTGDTANLAPQVENAVNTYVDESHTKQIAVLPLRESDPHADDKTRQHKRENMLGAIVIEQLVDSRAPDGMLQRVDVVRRHSATALTNAQAHEGLFLLPLWRLIGKSRVLVTARNLPKTISAAIVLAGLITAMCVVPWDFTVTANGKLLPEERRDVFAALNGTIERVNVVDGQAVKKGEIVAVQRSTDLDERFAQLSGDIAANEKEAAAAEEKRGGTDLARATPAEQMEIQFDLDRVEAMRAALEERRKILASDHERLKIASPIDGKVVTWRVKERLEGRPVSAGASLMEIADPSTTWELQLDVPEAKMGHINRQLREMQQKNQNAQLEVTFILATHPDPEDKLRGKITKIEPSAEVGGEGGNAVRMTVAFDQNELLKIIDENSGGKSLAVAEREQAIAQLKQNLKVGADVKAKIHCGRAAVGYVLFHELWEFIQSRILFWF